MHLVLLYIVKSTTLRTNEFGLVTLTVGNGTDKTGIISVINWGEDIYFLKTEADPAGGTTYIDMGTTQLLSVPYALYSKTSESATDAVKLTGDQIISGNKTFTGITTVQTPINATDASNKLYVDNILKILGLVPDNFAGIISDNEGNIYKTIKISNQVWMAENLKASKYSNGDTISSGLYKQSNDEM